MSYPKERQPEPDELGLERKTLEHLDVGSTLAWRVDDGRIDGVDVSGLGVAFLTTTTLDSDTKWRAVIHIDQRATPAQHDALLKLVTGQLGGAFADLATLIGKVSAIERSPIRIDLYGHGARLSIGTRSTRETVSSRRGSSGLGD
jgi:hypothetical protein